MPVPATACSYTAQIKMDETTGFKEMLIYVASVNQNKQKTYSRPDVKHIPDLGAGYKVSTPRAA